MRWILVLLVLPLASAEVVHEDPIGDQDAPHPALLKEFDIAEVQISNVTQDEWGFDGVLIQVAYDCPPPYTTFVTNRTTHFTFTVGNEAVRQGVWFSTLDWCSSGQGTGIPLGEGCVITDIFVEAVWRRPDGTHILDRAPDRAGLAFDACPDQPAGDEDLSAVTAEHALVESADPEGETPAGEQQLPMSAWLSFLAVVVALRRRF